MARVPYATLIATIMCCLGVGIFCGTMYRGATLCALMMDQVNCVSLVLFFKIKDPINLSYKINSGVSSASWMVGNGAASVCVDWSLYGSFRIHDFVRWLSCNWCYEAQSLPCMEISSGWTYLLCCCKYLKCNIFHYSPISEKNL